MADEQIVGSPEREIHVQALVQLEKVKTPVKEENEEEIYKMRAKLYRYHTDETDGSMWKERGVGDVKIMKHKIRGTYRVVMRRDKTLKLCANHALTANMEIKPHGSSDKAFIWSTPSDYADGEPTAETLCVRFGKPESATEFKDKFEECVKLQQSDSDKDSSDKLAKDLSSLNVKDDNDNTKQSESNDEAAAAATKNETTTNGDVPSVDTGEKKDGESKEEAKD